MLTNSGVGSESSVFEKGFLHKLVKICFRTILNAFLNSDQIVHEIRAAGL